MNIAYAPRSGVANLLLTEVAHKVQLPPGKYTLGRQRYDTMAEWIDRDGSPLDGLVSRIYGQGSAAIGAVVNAKFERDQFDVDAIVELRLRQDAPPAKVLDLLHVAIAGEKGSRYHDKTRRQSRCVTVEYDEMHIDFTPAVLVPGAQERTSIIFHAHEDEPASKHYHKIANPFGFVEWFKAQTPAEMIAFDEALAKAVTEPLPDLEDLTDKSLPLVALQLIKRWRNKAYDGRAGRMPPSVMLAFYIASATGRRRTLLEELIFHVANLHGIFARAVARGELVKVSNPSCSQDVLTDRWPESVAQEKVFLDDLAAFAKELAILQGTPTIPECRRVLSKLFGEKVTGVVIEEFAKRYTDRATAGGMHHQLGTGAIALAESGLSSRSYASNPTAPTPIHRNFGSDPE